MASKDQSEEQEFSMRELASIADDVEAGRTPLPPRWGFARPSPGVQVWTTPAGHHYACDSAGNRLPLPGGWKP